MRRPLADKDGEVRDLTAEDMRLFKPIAEVDPGISVPPIGGGVTPVIPPPGTPGGNQKVVPK